MAAFALNLRVSWGDADPAGILYTPRVFDYCTEALERWYAEVLGVDWVTMNRRLNLGSPMVHAACDYLRPGLELAVRVLIERLGQSSITFRIEGFDRDGAAYFKAKYVTCITDFVAAKAVSIPPDLRQRAEAYVRDCDASDIP